MPQVTVSVNGRSYRMACDEGQEERLIALGTRLDEAINGLRHSFGEVGDQRLTVMAALLMTDQLAEAEGRIAALATEMERLNAARNEALDRLEALEGSVADAIQDAASRIGRLADALATHQPGPNGG